MAAPMRTHRTWLPALGLLASLALLAACAMPLGPGYRLQRETVTVRYQPGSPLHVRGDAEMRNIGNAPLADLSLQIPRRAADGLAVWVAGRPVAPLAKTVADERRVTVPVDPPLGERSSLNLRLEYEIPAPPAGFVLEPPAWFANFLRPKHLFAKGRARAEKTEVEISVPSGYRAFTTGRKRGAHASRQGAETEYRYQVREDDFPPFLAIGRFNEQRIRAQGRNVVFWTLQPLDAGCARTLAAQLAAAANLYRSAFGPVSKHRWPISVFEISAGSGPAFREAGGFGSVPLGVSFSVAPAELCRQPQGFFAAADRALAATWFGWAVAPEPDARAIFVGGARRYAELIAQEGGSPAEARKRQVRAWVEEYDRLRARAKPIAPIRLESHSPAAERQMAGIQSALCLIALQDRFGPVPIQHALANLVSSLRYSTAGLDDVRSAFEAATGRNLFGFFNRWMGRPGIPEAFRQRYSAAKEKTTSAKGSITISRRAR